MVAELRVLTIFSLTSTYEVSNVLRELEKILCESQSGTARYSRGENPRLVARSGPGWVYDAGLTLQQGDFADAIEVLADLDRHIVFSRDGRDRGNFQEAKDTPADELAEIRSSWYGTTSPSPLFFLQSFLFLTSC